MGTSDFNIFWDRYGKKRERGDAERAWQRLTEKERQDAIGGISAYHRQAERQGTSILYPAAYLNQRLWQKARRQRGRRPSAAKAAVPSSSASGNQFYGMEIW